MKKLLLNAPVCTRYVWVHLVLKNRPWNYLFKEVKLLTHREWKFFKLFCIWQAAFENPGGQNNTIKIA